jgi:hypothetical protein
MLRSPCSMHHIRTKPSNLERNKPRQKAQVKRKVKLWSCDSRSNLCTPCKACFSMPHKYAKYLGCIVLCFSLLGCIVLCFSSRK